MFDGISTLFGALAPSAVEIALRQAVQVLRGAPQERAFRLVVARAVDRTAEEFDGDVHDALREHQQRLTALRGVEHLAAAVAATIAGLNEQNPGRPVFPPGLGTRLAEAVERGIHEEARAGGVLHSWSQQLIAVRTAERLAAVEGDVRAIRQAAAGAPVEGQPLQDASLDPGDARRRVLDAPFTGRDWLLREIDDFVAGHDRGYFVIEADAGTGKTAFALWCSQRQGWPLHFTRHSAAARQTGPAVRNLAAQLAEAYPGAGIAPHGRLPGQDWPALLHRALSGAARAARPAPVVVVIDGLDEAADTVVGDLPLGLPDDLPAGVYVVATVRTGQLPHQPAAPTVCCDWNRRGEQHRADLRAFLHRAALGPLAPLLRQAGVAADAFVEALLERSGDVWLYCHYVLEELAAGVCRPDDIPALPRGLGGYYRNAIARWTQTAAAPAQEAVLATLVVAREPLDVATLAELSGTDRRTVLDVLGGVLRPLLATGQGRWSVKHGSFTAFCTGGDDPAARTPADVGHWRERLAGAARDAHARIAGQYLDRWGGLPAGLPALAADPGPAGRHGGYPLRALAAHLLAAGRATDLHALLRCGAGARNVWYAAHDEAGDVTGFLDDIERARGALPPGDGPGQARYALVAAAVATASSNVRPALLTELVRGGRWSVPRALGCIRRMDRADQRDEALRRLAEHLPPEHLREAWAVARSLRADRLPAAAVALIERLPADLLEDAERLIARYPFDEHAGPATARLARRLPSERRAGFPHERLPCVDGAYRAMAEHLPQRPEAALAAALRQSVTFHACQVIAHAAAFLPPAGFAPALARLGWEKPRYRGDALVELAAHAPAGHLVGVLALATTTGWTDVPPESAHRRPWAALMRAAGPRLASPRDTEAALAVCGALDGEHRAEAIEALAPHLDAATARRVLRRLGPRRAGRLGHEAAIELAALAARLPADERRAVLAPHADPRLFPAEPAEVYSAVEIAAVWDLTDRARLAGAIRATVRVLARPEPPASAVAGPVLARLAPALRHDPTLLDEALDAAVDATAGAAAGRLAVLDALAPLLSAGPLDAAMTRLLPGPVETECFAAVAALIRTLPAGDRPAPARAALDRVRAIEHDRHRVAAVAALGPGLPGPLAAEALTLLVEAESRTRPAGAAATHRPAEPARTEPAHTEPADAEPAHPKAATAGQADEKPAAAEPHLANPAHAAPAGARAVSGVFALGPDARALAGPVRAALAALGPQLPVEELPRALELLMRTPGIGGAALGPLSGLLYRLGHDDPTRALWRYLRDPAGPQPTPERSWLWALAPSLDMVSAEAALPAAREQPGAARTVSLAALVPRLPPSRRGEVAEEVLAELAYDQEGEVWPAVLARLVAAVRTEAVHAACRRAVSVLWWPTIRMHVRAGDDLRALLAGLPDDLVEAAVEVSRRLAFVGPKCFVLAPLAPRLPAALLPGLEAEVESVPGGQYDDEVARGRWLAALAGRLDGPHRERIVAAMVDPAADRGWSTAGPGLLDLMRLGDPAVRARALAAALAGLGHDPAGFADLAGVLEGAEVVAALEAARRIAEPAPRVAAIAALLRRAGADETARTGAAAPALWPAARTRAELCTLLAAGAWWVGDHGRGAVTETIAAVFDAAEWWR